MKDLAIIGASYLQLPLIEKAKEMGYVTHVFAWAADDVGEKAADVFYPVSITEKEIILEKCREIGICGICSIASDLAAITVNYVANELGLPGNSMECTRKSTNKHLMRQSFEENGDPSPKSILVDEKTDLASLGLTYPLIVKPTDRSGSRGIYKLDSPEKLKESVIAAMAEGFEKKALIEEYVEGQEYSVEGISFHGEHTILAVTEKTTNGAPHFIEIRHLQPAPIRRELYEKICGVVIHALDTLGITNGASHSEIRIDEKENIRIIEIGGRMGGGCIGSDLVLYSTGKDYVRMVIQVACGMAPDLRSVRQSEKVESVFILDEKDDLEYKRLLRESSSIIRTAFYQPELFGKATDESKRAGCYIRKATDE